MSFDNAFAAWLSDSTGDYLINEKDSVSGTTATTMSSEKMLRH